MSRVVFLFWLDVLLLSSVTVLQTPKSTGLGVHEWGAIAFTGIVVVHLLVNWSWIARTLRRVRAARSWRERANLLLNVSLLVVVLLALFTGLMISEVLLPIIGLERSTADAWISLHRLFSTATLVMVGLHIALNWDWIRGVVRTRRRIRSQRVSPEPRLAFGRLDIETVTQVARRASVIASVAVTVSVVCYAMVSFSTDHKRRPAAASASGQLERSNGWIGYNGFSVQSESGAFARREGQAIFLEEVAMALLSIALAAVVGRTILRLRL